MASVTKFPYYKQDLGWLFSSWRQYAGRKGCAIIYSSKQTAVRMERKPPGYTPPKPSAAASAKPSMPAPPVKSQSAKADIPKVLGVECKNPPPFDMLDLPDAMDKEKFKIAAKLARKWFSGPSYTYDNHPDGPQPIVDTKTVTLSWALSYGSVKKNYEALYTKDVYSANAIIFVKKKLNSFFSKTFAAGGVITKRMDTLKITDKSVVRLHHEFQFQLNHISTLATIDDFGPTDLTAALGSFNLYAAIGEFQVVAHPEYNDSSGGKQQVCYTPTVTITHVYIYAKDNYSFNDEKSSSQYLGHWNKSGIIMVSPTTVASTAAELVDTMTDRVDLELGNYPVTNYIKMFGSVSPDTVYYPIRNRDFRAWRSKFNKGGDIMVYSNVKKIKLAKPITVILDKLCKNS